MIRYLTLNLRHNRDRVDERQPMIIDLLQAESPDVIAMQEAWLASEQAQKIAAALNQRNPERPYQVFLEPKWGDAPREGIAMLSRLPVQEHERLELPELERVAQRIQIDLDGTVINLANTHLHHMPIDDESIRLPQMQALMGWMFARKDRRWLLAGDMNAQPDSETIRTITTRLVSAYASVNGNDPLTFPTPLVDGGDPAVAIDYIFYDPRSFTVKSARVIGDQAHPDDEKLYPSDHFGLVADFETI